MWTEYLFNQGVSHIQCSQLYKVGEVNSIEAVNDAICDHNVADFGGCQVLNVVQIPTGCPLKVLK